MRFSRPSTASKLRRPISESTTATFLFCIARAVPRFAVVVVLPTPPLPDVMVITLLSIGISLKQSRFPALPCTTPHGTSKHVLDPREDTASDVTTLLQPPSPQQPIRHNIKLPPDFLLARRAPVHPCFDDDLAVADRGHLWPGLNLQALRRTRKQVGDAQLDRGQQQ